MTATHQIAVGLSIRVCDSGCVFLEQSQWTGKESKIVSVLIFPSQLRKVRDVLNAVEIAPEDEQSGCTITIEANKLSVRLSKGEAKSLPPDGRSVTGLYEVEFGLACAEHASRVR